MEKTKENLKQRILEAIASRDVEQMQALRTEIWMRKSPVETFDAEFLAWRDSEEGQ